MKTVSEPLSKKLTNLHLDCQLLPSYKYSAISLYLFSQAPLLNMKFSSLFPAILIAFHITPSLSAPVSRIANPNVIKRQSSTFAQGDCTSQQIAGQPQVSSGDCGQGDTSGNSAADLNPTVVDNENNSTKEAATYGGGTNSNVGVAAGKHRGVVSGSNGGSLTGNNRGTTTGNDGSTTTDNGVGNGHGNNGIGNGRGNGIGTADSNPGTRSSNASTTPSTSADPSALVTSFIAKLKGTIALPQLNNIISRLRSEFSIGQNADSGGGGSRGGGAE